uniref:Zinc transporter ZIP13 n=1 Tax=Timema tahoe TaxID=61484 RepID=A0A7R9NU84_9NEOP|nr:unnamed protein product [Timema tahoe]
MTKRHGTHLRAQLASFRWAKTRSKANPQRSSPARLSDTSEATFQILFPVSRIFPLKVSDSPVHPCMEKGLWVLAGLLIFVFLEKAFALPPTETSELDMLSDTNKYKVNGFMPSHNNNHKGLVVCDKNVLVRNGHIANHETDVISVKPGPIHVSGYLNLMANSFDNFTHGLAVGGSFLVSFPHGVLTTFAILLHEIPHEVGDFAILLKSGFSRWEAAKAQLCTATAGIFGALVAIILSGSSGTVAARTSWILPFTAGGFLHIALVTVLPDLLKEENPKESMLQLLSLLGGITVMATMSFLVE